MDHPQRSTTSCGIPPGMRTHATSHGEKGAAHLGEFVADAVCGQEPVQRFPPLVALQQEVPRHPRRVRGGFHAGPIVRRLQAERLKVRRPLRVEEREVGERDPDHTAPNVFASVCDARALGVRTSG